MVQSHFNTSALFEGSMIPQMAVHWLELKCIYFCISSDLKIFLKQELCNPQSSTAVKPGICQIVRYQLFHFYRTQTLHGNFCEPFLLRNLAFKRSFSRYGRKMALALASSSTQFSAVCSSGNCKKVQTWFFKVRNYSETSDCLFLHEKNMSKCSYRSKI